MIAQIATGITSKYTGSALASSLTGGLWRDEAKQGVSFPCGIFTVIDSLNTETFTEDMEFFRIQFDLWAQYSSSTTDARATLDTLESALRTLFDNATLTISGWTNIGMRWIGTRPGYSEDDQVVGLIVEYETYIQK